MWGSGVFVRWGGLPVSDQDWMTPAEAAAMVGVQEKKINRYCGGLAAQRLRCRRQYPEKGKRGPWLVERVSVEALALKFQQLGGIPGKSFHVTDGNHRRRTT